MVETIAGQTKTDIPHTLELAIQRHNFENVRSV